MTSQWESSTRMTSPTASLAPVWRAVMSPWRSDSLNTRVMGACSASHCSKGALRSSAERKDDMLNSTVFKPLSSRCLGVLGWYVVHWTIITQKTRQAAIVHHEEDFPKVGNIYLTIFRISASWIMKCSILGGGDEWIPIRFPVLDKSKVEQREIW